MLTLNDGYTFLYYLPASNQVVVAELSRTAVVPTRTFYSLPDFLAAITPEQADDID